MPPLRCGWVRQQRLAGAERQLIGEADRYRAVARIAGGNGHAAEYVRAQDARVQQRAGGAGVGRWSRSAPPVRWRRAACAVPVRSCGSASSRRSWSGARPRRAGRVREPSETVSSRAAASNAMADAQAPAHRERKYTGGERHVLAADSEYLSPFNDSRASANARQITIGVVMPSRLRNASQSCAGLRGLPQSPQ